MLKHLDEFLVDLLDVEEERCCLTPRHLRMFLFALIEEVREQRGMISGYAAKSADQAERIDELEEQLEAREARIEDLGYLVGQSERLRQAPATAASRCLCDCDVPLEAMRETAEALDCQVEYRIHANGRVAFGVVTNCGYVERDTLAEARAAAIEQMNRHRNERPSKEPAVADLSTSTEDIA